MPRSAAWQLQSELVGPLPVINHFLDRLGVDAAFARYVPHTDRRCRLAPARGLGVLVRNILDGRRPVYGLQEWAAPFDRRQLRLGGGEARLLNDDRVGRALDRLFDADRASLVTELIVRAVREFEIALERLHNDSTTVTFAGQYAAATGQRRRGKRTLRIAHGHNKDHRPDLKQLLWILTVSADGAVPIHYRAGDGNTTDDQTHIETWETVRRLVGHSDFLYVADSKLCTRPAMSHITGQGGRFLTVLPRTRREDAWFRDWIQTHPVPWEEVVRRRHPRRQDGPPDIYRVTESPIRSAEGYRILWVWSSLKAEHDALARQARIEQGIRALETLATRLRGPRSRLRRHAAVDQAVQGAVDEAGAARWLECTIEEIVETHFRQETRGRPGHHTRYLRRQRPRFQLTWHLRTDRIEYDARSDGMFPLTTNWDAAPAADLLHHYKYQPQLEKRHEQLKTVRAVAPVFLKSVTRIEALLLLYFLALLVDALIERQVRHGMQAAQLTSLPLYPEERRCKAPTTDRVFDVLRDLRRHHLVRRGVVVQTFQPELSDLQRQLLELLGIPLSAYGHRR
jgi:hypothetical protein